MEHRCDGWITVSPVLDREQADRAHENLGVILPGEELRLHDRRFARVLTSDEVERAFQLIDEKGYDL
jgi:hypothetical protein